MAVTNVVLFCGGRGSATIIRALLARADIDLSLVVNPFDDGKSTGALRLFIPGMLGPSDFRKNISYLLDLAIPGNDVVRELLEYRFPDGAAFKDVQTFCTETFMSLSHELRFALGLCVNRFGQYASLQPEFDYSDCSMGNIIFAGAYLKAGSFNATVKWLSDLFDLRANLVNVSKGECCVLQALKADGTFLPNEAAIVGEQSDVPIVGYYLVDRPVTEQELELAVGWSGRPWYMRDREAKVELSDEAATAIAEADIIIYGPGTQHSSLLPSYRIACEAILNAPATVRCLIVNLEHDNDTQGLGAQQLVDNALEAMGDPDNAFLVVTDILANVAQGPKDVVMDLTRPYYLGARVVVGNFDDGKVHHAQRVLRAIDNAPRCIP